MRVLSMFLDPAALSWMLLVGLGLFFWAKRQRLAGSCLLVLCLGWWAMEVAQCPARMVASLEAPYRQITNSETPRADAIVVLGGNVSPSNHELTGVDFESAADRVLTGVHLAREQWGKVLVLGGGKGREPDARSEGELLADWLNDWKVTRADIVALPPSRNTREEAVHATALAREREWDRVILVTSAWHLRRASAAFREEGLAVIPVGCDFAGSTDLDRPRRYLPQTRSLRLLQLWLHEIVGYEYYRLRSWV